MSCHWTGLPRPSWHNPSNWEASECVPAPPHEAVVQSLVIAFNRRFPALLASVIVLASCAPKKAEDPLARLSSEFVFTALSFAPVAATQAGYHAHGSVVLDELLDDYSPSGMERQRRYYVSFRKRLAAINARELSPEDGADYRIISDQISLSLLEYDRIRAYRHNPTIYVELIGNALFNPYALEYAPKPVRFRHIIARLTKVPALLNQARTNLVGAPEIWIRVALEENEGNLELIDKTLREQAPEELRPEYDSAAAVALDALHSFDGYLADDLAARDSQGDWRLGRDLYAEKFRYVLATEHTPEQVLSAAEAGILAARERMLALARQLVPDASGDEGAVIRSALNDIARRHATRQTYFAEARQDLEEARQFVQARNLVQLPAHDNLQVIETPKFMRGIYGVGGFAPAPALEPKLGAFYWITPVPLDWPQGRAESKLREYNFYKLKLLTLHEAVPGHYVQFEHAAEVQPDARRVLRSVYGNGPYIEGWAQYSTQVMLDEGFLDHSRELKLTFLKEELRVLANAILDIRLHTTGMTDEQALELLETRTFQEAEEAEAKLKRAKLSSCQLPTYYVGWQDWLRVRDEYRQSLGAEYKLAEFHQRALGEGAVPLPVLKRLLARPAGAAALSR